MIPELVSEGDLWLLGASNSGVIVLAVCMHNELEKRSYILYGRSNL